LLKKPKVLIFDEATSSLDFETAEHFAATVNQMRGKIGMLFISHAIPRGLLVDSTLRIGVLDVGPSNAPVVASQDSSQNSECLDEVQKCAEPPKRDF
jgi:ABC-type bacteriocin/lantibiotic exporter with double-glycine peptidase domain